MFPSRSNYIPSNDMVLETVNTAGITIRPHLTCCFEAKEYVGQKQKKTNAILGTASLHDARGLLTPRYFRQMMTVRVQPTPPKPSAMSRKSPRPRFLAPDVFLFPREKALYFSISERR
jgi:hypothetical protein